MAPSTSGLIGALAVCCAGTELFARLPVVMIARRMAQGAADARHIVRSRAISDHWKEKAMAVYAGRMARQTLALASAFLLLAGVAAALLALMAPIAPEAGHILTSAGGIMLGLGTAIVYFAMRCWLVR